MFSPLRNRFGIPGAISVIALVFAMIGGAYAASDSGGSGSKATASAKKGPPGPRGPRGKPGKPGAAGPAGPQGPAGANGKDGANGLNGLDGEQGPEGKAGPTGKTGPTGATGATGTAGAAGPTGATGPTGEPWTAGGTLPPGETETGTWAFGMVGKGGSAGPPCLPIGCLGLFRVPISFPIPLATELEEANVHRFKQSDPPTTECPGSAADPEALPGHLCVYTASESTPNEEAKTGKFTWSGPLKLNGLGGASTAGATLGFTNFQEGAFAVGAWAVTAPPS